METGLFKCFPDLLSPARGIMTGLFFLSGLFFAASLHGQSGHFNDKITSSEPVNVGIIGLVHDHVHWILGREEREDITIVGIVEPNRDLAEQYSKRYGYSMDIVYDSIEEMTAAATPDAVTAFNPIHGHLDVVEHCAPRGIHVMVEKPLAVSWDHARKMAELANRHGIHLLTNYETSWYSSNALAYDLAVIKKDFGEIRKLVFYTGHRGPIEIGCSDAFLEWLTNPKLNGGGARVDFGCYGANLATWLLRGEKPVSVSCISRQIKPDLYPDVEDDATIVINYPGKQVIIQASWNWPFNRKEMELYGQTGYIKCLDNHQVEIMYHEEAGPEKQTATKVVRPDDPFAFLAGVVRGQIKLQPADVSALENNLIVVQILELAKISAAQGRTILWNEFFPGE